MGRYPASRGKRGGNAMDPAVGPGAGESGAGMSAEAVRKQLSRICHSRAFAAAPTLGRLLEYLVEQTLDGRGSRLKEYAVGVEVLGRPPSFDPHIDTIVRVHARRLRQRLDEYYADEGRADAVVIDLPKGHYAARWRRAARDAGGEADGGVPSLVVLPLANLSDDPDNEYFADGLTDELIAGLASLHGLRVVARTSAFQFKGRSEDVREIGRILGAQMALEGSVRRDGTSMRVVVQLVDAGDGFQRWSQTYERDVTGTFRLQDEITKAIVAALGERLRAEATTVRTAAPASADAHDCYLKGRYFWNKATPEAVAKSIEYLERAIRLDPAYAAAHAGLADAYIYLATLEAEAPGPLLARARAAARQALELEELAEGRSALGVVLGIGDWDWEGAEREFTRALQLAPSYAHARGAYAIGCLAPLRRHDTAAAQLRLAIRHDPLSVFLRSMLGQVLLLRGGFEEAIDELEHVLELDPGNVPGGLTLAWARAGAQDFEGSIQALQSLPAAATALPNYAGHLGYAHARLGRSREAADILQELLARFPGPWVPGVDVAAIHNGLGDTEKALYWLQQARDFRSFDAVFVADDPRFANLHGDPRAARLLSP